LTNVHYGKATSKAIVFIEPVGNGSRVAQLIHEATKK
jgi:hypothetical protein